MFSTHATRHHVPTFKHYSRKGYSVFASLKREVRIGVLGVALVSAPQVMKADAQQSLRQLRRTDGTEQAPDETTLSGSALMLLSEQQPLPIATASAPQPRRPRSTRRAIPHPSKAKGADVRPRRGFVHQADTLPTQPSPHSFMLRQHRIRIALPGSARRLMHPRPIDWPMHHLHPTYTASPPHTPKSRPLPPAHP